MEATLSTEDKVFLSSLSPEDRHLTVGGVLGRLECITCALDASELMYTRLNKLRNDVCIRFVEERAREPHPIVLAFLEQIDTFIRYVDDYYNPILREQKHYLRLHHVLEQKAVIDRINRNAGIGDN